MMDILVTGAGASGGFLMTRLMTSFEGYKGNSVNPGEVFSLHSKHFFDDDCRRGVVRKGDHSYLLCGCHPPWEEEQARKMTEMKGRGELVVVHIIRNGMDVLRRRPSHRVAEIWMDSARQYLDYKEVPDVVVRYEDLCSDPDGEQKRIARKTGLRASAHFSEYPSFVVGAYTHGVKDCHKLRPIDTKRISGADVNRGVPGVRRRVKKIPNDPYRGRMTKFLEYQERLGYA